MLEEALQEISRGSSEIIDNERITKLLAAYFEKGETYTVKAGFDPTAPDLHLGHTVLLQKLATFPVLYVLKKTINIKRHRNT